MSETTKATEAVKRTTDQAARSSQASIDAAGKTAKEAISETSQVAQNGADRIRKSPRA